MISDGNGKAVPSADLILTLTMCQAEALAPSLRSIGKLLTNVRPILRPQGCDSLANTPSHHVLISISACEVSGQHGVAWNVYLSREEGLSYEQCSCWSMHC